MKAVCKVCLCSALAALMSMSDLPLAKDHHWYGPDGGGGGPGLQIGVGDCF